MSSLSNIILKSSDGERFEILEAVAVQSHTIKNMIEDDSCIVKAIPLPNVTGTILGKVLEYCKKHTDIEDDLTSWDTEFLKVDSPTLIDLVLAANYLNIKSLLDLTCQTVADMIKGKTPGVIRKTFDIKNDFIDQEVNDPK